MRQLDVSISKFIADMHVEIWWSRKICFYTNVFSSVQLRSFLYLDAHVQPSSLQHIFPLGLNYATHPTPSFQLKQSAIHQLYTDNFKTRVKLNLRQKYICIKFLLSVGEVDFQFRLTFSETQLSTTCSFTGKSKYHAIVTCFYPELTS